MTIKQIRKAVIAVGAACGTLGAALADGTLTGNEIIGVALAFAGAIGVYVVPNDAA